MELEIARLPVSPDQADAMVATIETALSGFLAPPACMGVDVARGEGEVVAVMRWVSAEAHHAASKMPQAAQFFADVQRLSSGPPSIENLSLDPGGRLAGQVALVTGGASGIGRAVVDAFVAEGARVGVADRDEARLAEVAAAHGDRVHAVTSDLSTVAGNARAVEETVAAFSRLDTFVANAGLFDGFLDFAAATPEQLDTGFDAVFGINTRGLILGCHSALPHLVRTRGSIIVTLSNASLYPDGGGILYVASKHAALGVVRQLAHELAPAVRVNAVAPGATKTAIGVPDLLGGPLDQTVPEISAAIASVIPAGFHAEAADHAAAYVLLAAAGESRAMTGTVIESDGGLGVRGLRRTRGGDALALSFGDS